MSEIGIVGSGPVTVVESSGALRDLGGSARVDWWVGADDRWHVATREHAVRQRAADSSAIVETRLRIPGGDAVARTTVAPDRGSAAALLAIENDSPVPVALAIVVELPEASVISIDDDRITVDGRCLVWLGRAVARSLVAGDTDELIAGVEAGRATPPAEVAWPQHGRAIAAIVPLPHTASVRAAIGWADVGVRTTPAGLPPLEAVARGWDAHLGTGASLAVPDERLARVIDAARRHLLVGSAQPPTAPFWAGVEGWIPPVAAAALDAWSHTTEARELLLAASGTDDLVVHARRSVAEAGSLLWAWADRLERAPDPDIQQALMPWVEDVAVSLMRPPRRFGRRDGGDDAAWRAVGLAAAGSLLSRFGDGTVGPDIVDAIPRLVGELDDDLASVPLALGASRVGLGQGDLWAALGRRLGVAGASRWSMLGESAGPLGELAAGDRTQHPLASALALLAARRSLVDEPGGAGGPLALLTHLDDEWYGAPIEAHGFPVAGGTASFGVRWHGPRPAILWDVDVGERVVSVSAPGVDGEWSDDRSQGEALLGPTLGLEVADPAESAPVRRGERLDPDNPPTSFG